ncbi:MAG: protein-L-isoaspartate(D-aspartate) O-methyltransferase [Deltaproteobacteria bacterium]|nr:protein-L-isoaspartate(D-aspartate) O-methyltransferase [Deltaproteobacteria bacterium]MBW2256976.1 protein-L-isoaspartate(D-aspartate) O-methyltransferase [Deltaproteobacteria bacterium]
MLRVWLMCSLLLSPAVACAGDEPATDPVLASEESRAPTPEDAYQDLRHRMVRTQIEARGLRDPEVLRAMRTVPRHRFMPESTWTSAYADFPVAIGEQQTISQPYIVAFMTELARVGRGDKVLEIGTGSGYQAAVLAEVGAQVYSIEILEPLAKRARQTLDDTGYGRIHTRVGDGYRGWPEEAPFDAVVVTAAPGHVPLPLKEQLAVGGRLVIPVGGRFRQELMVIERTERGFREESALPVLFVPMTGEAQQK